MLKYIIFTDKRNVKTASFTKSAKKTPTYKSQSKNENVNKPQKTIDDSQKLSMAGGIKKNINENHKHTLSQNVPKNDIKNKIKKGRDDEEVSVQTSETGVQECLKSNFVSTMTSSENELKINDNDDALCQRYLFNYIFLHVITSINYFTEKKLIP